MIKPTQFSDEIKSVIREENNLFLLLIRIKISNNNLLHKIFEPIRVILCIRSNYLCPHPHTAHTCRTLVHTWAHGHHATLHWSSHMLSINLRNKPDPFLNTWVGRILYQSKWSNHWLKLHFYFQPLKQLYKS